MFKKLLLLIAMSKVVNADVLIELRNKNAFKILKQNKEIVLKVCVRDAETLVLACGPPTESKDAEDYKNVIRSFYGIEDIEIGGGADGFQKLNHKLDLLYLGFANAKDDEDKEMVTKKIARIKRYIKAWNTAKARYFDYLESDVKTLVIYAAKETHRAAVAILAFLDLAYSSGTEGAEAGIYCAYASYPCTKGGYLNEINFGPIEVTSFYWEKVGTWVSRSPILSYSSSYGFYAPFKLDDPYFELETGWLGNIPDFALVHLEESLNDLENAVYGYRAPLFSELKTYVQKFSAKTNGEVITAEIYENTLLRLFILNAIEPMVKGIDSPSFTEKVLPAYLAAKEQWNAKLRKSNLSDFELNDQILGASLLMLVESVKGSKLLLSEKSIDKEMTKFIAELGLIQGRIAAHQPIKEITKGLTNSLKDYSSLIQKITEARRLQGFGILIQKIESYLESK